MQRRVGIGDQRRRVAAIARKYGNADAGADADAVPVDRKLRLERGAQAVRDHLGGRRLRTFAIRLSSSPPTREQNICCAAGSAAGATARSAASPIAWPSTSSICLKRSTSRAQDCKLVSGAARLFEHGVQFCWNAARVGARVRASCSARYLIRASAVLRSVTSSMTTSRYLGFPSDRTTTLHPLETRTPRRGVLERNSLNMIGSSAERARWSWAMSSSTFGNGMSSCAARPKSNRATHRGTPRPRG